MRSGGGLEGRFGAASCVKAQQRRRGAPSGAALRAERVREGGSTRTDQRFQKVEVLRGADSLRFGTSGTRLGARR